MRFRYAILAIAATAGLLACFAAGEIATRPANHKIGAPPGGLPIDDVSFKDGRGKAVAGWSVEGARDKGTILLLHGVRADRRSMVRRARFLAKSGYTVLMIDLQAHGESPGDLITFGHLEAESVSAAIRFARSKWPGKRVGVIGQSLGGASAIFAAKDQRADAYILETVYSTLREATENRLRLRLGAIGPLLAPLLLWQLPLRLGLGADDLSPAASVPQLGRPVLIIAGDKDRRTTLENSMALFANAKQPKSLWVIPGAKHQDFLRFEPAEYKRRVLDFLDRHLR